jgi:hypothetical protein
MPRFIAPGVSVLIGASFLSLEQLGSTPAPQKPGSGTKVAIPRIEPRSEDVSTVDGMVRAYLQSFPVRPKRNGNGDATRPCTFPEYGF